MLSHSSFVIRHSDLLPLARAFGRPNLALNSRFHYFARIEKLVLAAARAEAGPIQVYV
jgi:hypothetical protein